MRYEVVFTEDAERDLDARHTPGARFAAKKLRSVGIQDYRQVFFKPYRVIYRVQGSRAIVYVIHR